MNVFYIPSWYPSCSDPLAGGFFREQAIVMSRNHPDVHIGISVWGQNDDRLLLWSSKPLSSVIKIIRANSVLPEQKIISDRVTEYFTPSFTWTWKIRKGNIRNIINANLKNFNAFREQNGKVNIIHAHVGFPAGYVAMKLSSVTGIPYLITEHMSPFPFKYFKGIRGGLAGRIMDPYRCSAVNIAVSQALKEKMEDYGVPKVKVVYNSVDEDLFDLQGIKIPSSPFTFFTLGRMVPQKGIDILLRAISLLPSNKKVIFRIGGDGPELHRYKDLAADLKITSRVQWAGALNREETAREMRKCHAFVLPSRHESMGIVFAEAIACGKPVIGTRCGGPEEIINETNGLLIPGEDPKALTNALLFLMKHYNRFDTDSIRTDFMRRFSSKVITDQIMKIYRGSGNKYLH